MENLQATLNELAWRSSNKLCPLPMMSGQPPVKCLGHDCARWNPHNGSCCDGTSYLSMDYIGHQIGQLSDLIRVQTDRLLQEDKRP